ncbi:kelch repeat and BTB domain-containing protein 7 [Ornithorhynchus anatinus]|uniref:Kelch repeat and BTB domain containing 7 n=1 Tax=Ornithorhynchus anatinus TaxID=9258 RepID=A0A6I8PKG6_ORNAN|nr:kelch repeat and BTB domain-containing protein 7 [Ornithorhynchus anatinus]
MQSREEPPRPRRVSTPRRGRRARKMAGPSVSSFFSGPEELEDAGHAPALLAQLKAFYDARLLCDVTIEVAAPAGASGPGRLFACNRNVLAAACPYFRSMFTGGLYESQQPRVTMHDVDAESLALLLDYCYTGRVAVSEANVQRLYAAADMLQLDYVREACAAFLARRLDLANCAAILRFADAFDHPRLRARALAFVARNFTRLSRAGAAADGAAEEAPPLSELSLAQLQEVLRLDSLDVAGERTVCAVAVQWVEADPRERGPRAAEVLQCVRWRHFADRDRAYLEGLRAKPFVRKHCPGLVEGALSARYGDRLPPVPPGLAPDPAPDLAPAPAGPPAAASAEGPARRIGMMAKEMVVFFGHPKDPFLCYDPYSGDIYTMPSPLTGLAQNKAITSLAVCVSPDNDIYLAAQPKKQLWVYDPVQNSWQQLADRLLCREGMDLAYLDGHVYILGGRNPVTGVKLKEVECYSVQRNQWVLVAPVPYSFYSFELIMVHGHLYAVSNKRMLCYDPSRNRWLNCASLKRSDFQEACVYNEEIYCICDIPVVKVYNPARGEWRRVSDIPLDAETHNYQIVCHGQKLLLVTSTTLQWKKNRVTVHEYDAAADRWLNVGTMLGLLHYDSGFICLSARVYPSRLEPGRRFIAEEDDVRHELRAYWGLNGFSELDSESGSSSSF